MATIDIAPPDTNDDASRSTDTENPHRDQYTQSAQAEQEQKCRGDDNHKGDDPESVEQQVKDKKNGMMAVALTFGAVLPTLFATICATAHFEGIWRLTCRVPVETIIQAILIALVPVANMIVADAISKRDSRFPLRLGLLQGAAIGSSALITTVSFAAYLLTLTPVGNVSHNTFYIVISVVSLLATLASIYIGSLYRNTKETRAARNKTVIYAALGMLLSVVSLLGSEGRSAYIRFVEWQASSENAAEREQAIDTLRALGTERDLRMEIADPRVGGFSGIFYQLNPTTIRQLYFSVAGRPYLDQYTDIATMPSEFLSRDIVGENIQGLSLIRSTMTGSVNPDSLTSTINWVFIFKNRSMFNQEARAQIALPAGGVVSGLTLHVNGKPQPAAFAGNDRVSGAYNWVEHSKRDPALVTFLGKERVLLQCSPVPAQGEMKVALSIAAPVNLQTKSDASIALPKLINSNFTIIPSTEHTLRLRTPKDSEISMEKVRRSANAAQSLIVGEMKAGEMTAGGLTLRVHNVPEFKQLAAFDPLSKSYIVETVHEVVPSVPTNLVVVVDGSARMKEYSKQVRSVLSKLPKNVATTMLVAADKDIGEPVSVDEGLKQIEHLNYKGGCDNLRAVVKAAEVAGENKQGAVLWLHGPQPSLNNEFYAMAPYVHVPRFFEVALDGADSNTSEFFKNHREIGPFSVVASGPAAMSDLERYLCRWQPGGREFVSNFTCTFDKPNCRLVDPKASPEQSRELIALGASDQCNKLIAKNHRNLAASLASQAQIVSQLTGAVVLERESDYLAWKSRRDNQQRAIHIQGVTNGTIGPEQEASSDAFSPPAIVQGFDSPQLQGATSGTSGPQGDDATVIVGVNTAGTVRVNNLVRLETTLNVLTILAELTLIIIGGTNLVLAVTKGSTKFPFSNYVLGPLQRGVIGAVLVSIGLLIPGMLNWLFASARDANLFS